MPTVIDILEQPLSEQAPGPCTTPAPTPATAPVVLELEPDPVGLLPLEFHDLELLCGVER